MANRIPLAEQGESNVVFSKSSNGQFVKRVRGHVYCFGTDENQARKLWMLHRDSLISGRGWAVDTAGQYTLKDIANLYLEFKKKQIAKRELTEQTYIGTRRILRQMISVIGDVAINTLNPNDFAKLSTFYVDSKNYMLSTQTLRVDKIVAMINWAIKRSYFGNKRLFDIIGDEFEKPSCEAIAREKEDQPELDVIYESWEILKLLEHACPTMKCAIYLGINGAFNPSDFGNIREKHIDLEAGHITFRRPKTMQHRFTVLWPETVQAIKDYLEVQPKPRTERDAEFVFLSQYGKCYVGTGRTSHLTERFKLLKKELGLYRKGRGLKHLRHTFRTVTSELIDSKAVDTIMGHSQTVSDVYVKRPLVKRVKKVCKYVRKWLLPKPLPSP